MERRQEGLEKIIEELKGSAVAAVFAGMLLLFILYLFTDSSGEIAEAAKKFAQSIGGH